MERSIITEAGTRLIRLQYRVDANLGAVGSEIRKLTELVDANLADWMEQP